MPHPRSLFAVGVLAAALVGCAAPGFLSSTPALDVAGSKHQGDYLPAYRFQLVIDGKVAGVFHDIQGLDAPTLIGGDLDGDGGLDVARKHIGRPIYEDVTMRKGRPGRPTYGNLTFEEGLVKDASLLEWVQKGGGDCDDTDSCLRKSGSIIYLDRAGQETKRLNFFEAWPVRMKAPPSRTGVVQELELSFEKIEIAVEKIER